MPECSTSRSLKLFPEGMKFKLLDNPPPFWSRSRTDGRFYETGRACDVCAMPVEGAVFHCEEEGLDVHPTCALLEKTIVAGDVVFELRRGEAKSDCLCCSRKKPTGSYRKIKGFRYESRRRDLTFHIFCLLEMHRSPASVVPSTRLMKTRRSSDFDGVVQTFLITVFSVLVGDPTAVAASVLMQILRF